MKILIHAARGTQKAAALEKQVQDQLADIKIFRSLELEGFAGQLRQPMNNISVIIIFVPTLEALNALFALKSFLNNKKLILVLTDPDSQTFIRGLQLNPSFISRADEDGEDVFRVLERIIGRQQAMTRISMQLNTYK